MRIYCIYTDYEGGTSVLIRIQPSSTVPIYEQIAQQIKTLISNGTLTPGASLPSIYKGYEGVLPFD